MNLLLTDVEVDGRRCDVRVRGGRVVGVAAGLEQGPADDETVGGQGGVLLPGLHDHHIHLLATAAAAASVSCGPPAVADIAGLERALQDAAGQLTGGEWLRGIGYVESVAGDLDRHMIDRLVADRPVRVQHRSGALWVLNTAGLRAARLDDVVDADAERDAHGELTGRLWRFDARLRQRLADDATPPDLCALSRRLSSYGITGVTDATADLDVDTTALLTTAVASGQLTQHLLLLGGAGDAQLPDGVASGPRKILLPDHDLPAYDEVVATIERSHAAGRPVAVHCVTRESLLLTVVALTEVGSLPGDRIEHAAVVPPDVVDTIATLGVAVVTQPSFVAERGDDYLRDVAADDLTCLYPYASLLDAGIAVAPSSDAPYGVLDPWRTLVAGRDRTTTAGNAVNAGEAVDTHRILDGFLSSPLQPGGTPRQVAVGNDADLCLLDAPLRDVLIEPAAERVRLVVRGGKVVYSA